MSGLNGRSGEYTDTNSELFNQEVLNIGTTQVEAITTALTDKDNRQFLHLYNQGNQTVYYGPSGVTSSTGIPILKDEWVEIAISRIPVYLITDSGTSDVIVTELG